MSFWAACVFPWARVSCSSYSSSFYLHGNQVLYLKRIVLSKRAGKHYCKQVDWMDSTGREMTLWQSMLNRPNFWVEGCVVMRSTLEGGGRYNA